MSFSPRVPLMLPVLKINGKTDRTADTLCCLRALGSATQDATRSCELPGRVPGRGKKLQESMVPLSYPMPN